MDFFASLVGSLCAWCAVTAGLGARSLGTCRAAWAGVGGRGWPQSPHLHNGRSTAFPGEVGTASPLSTVKCYQRVGACYFH